MDEPNEDNDDEFVGRQLRHHFVRTPKEQVIAEHLMRLDREVTRSLRSRQAKRFAIPAGLAVAATLVVGIVVSRSQTTRTETATSQTMPREEPTVPTASSIAVAPAAVEDRSPGQSTPTTATALVPASSSTPTSAGTASSAPTSAVATSGTTPAPTQPSIRTTPTTTPATTTPATTRSTTTNPSTTQVTLPLPVGTPFQDRLYTELVLMNRCLLDDGEVFVGYAGESDHPKTSDPGYLAAVDRCEPATRLRATFDAGAEWERGLNRAQRALADAALRPVHQCLTSRSWDVGTLVVNPRGLLASSRIPAVTADQFLNGQFDRDFNECGWFSLQLG